MLANFIQREIIQEIEEKYLKCSLVDCINRIQQLFKWYYLLISFQWNKKT